MTLRILVVGAGIGGLAAARGLRVAGDGWYPASTSRPSTVAQRKKAPQAGPFL